MLEIDKLLYIIPFHYLSPIFVEFAGKLLRF